MWLFKMIVDRSFPNPPVFVVANDYADAEKNYKEAGKWPSGYQPPIRSIEKVDGDIIVPKTKE